MGEPHCWASRSREQARLGTCDREESIFAMCPSRGVDMSDPIISQATLQGGHFQGE